MQNIAAFFLLATFVGCFGIWQFIAGARASADGRYVEMSSHHFFGVLCLTAAAALTWYDVRDATYLLMQTPFILGSVQTYAQRHFVWKTLQGLLVWWGFRLAVALNGLLIFYGIVVGIVTSTTAFVQVVGAGFASSGLAKSDIDPKFKLGILATGRFLLCVSSGWKFVLTFDNAAAFVWTCLMGWATYQTYVAYCKAPVQRA